MKQSKQLELYKNKLYQPLEPDGFQKSFYNKALTYTYSDGLTVLYSYDVPIIARDADGNLYKLWSGEDFWTTTTGRHIKAFCGLNKKAFLALPLVHTNARRPHTWYVLETQDYLENARLLEVLADTSAAKAAKTGPYTKAITA